MSPVLSIIIPLYNTEQYIGQCIRSIVDGNINPSLYEIIVVDDGSTDSSADIVNGLCSSFENIHLLRQENKGVSTARMAGAAQAKGAYIWFIDSDDWIEENALTQVLGNISSNTVDILITPFVLRFPDSRNDFISPVITKPDVVEGRNLLRTKQYIFVGPPYFVFKRSFLEDSWLYFPEHTRFEDEYFSRVLLYRAKTIQLLTEPLYNYRQNLDSFMHSSNIESASFFITVYSHLKRFADSEVDKTDKKWFSYNITSFLLESIVRNLDQVNRTGFSNFRKKHLPFIRREFLANISCFPLKEQFLGLYLLFFPKAYAWSIKKHNARKVSQL